MGATAPVACGQRAQIGIACCGACGCVPVEVYFDGTHCWQGVPECKAGELANQMFSPHLPTSPNPSFTLPGTIGGSFYQGSGGFAGSEAVSGSAGTSGTAGTSGYGGVVGASANAGTSGDAGTGGSDAGAGESAL